MANQMGKSDVASPLLNSGMHGSDPGTNSVNSLDLDANATQPVALPDVPESWDGLLEQ